MQLVNFIFSENLNSNYLVMVNDLNGHTPEDIENQMQYYNTTDYSPIEIISNILNDLDIEFQLANPITVIL